MQSIHKKILLDNKLKCLKFGVWTYFILLLFEGALRKWVLPGLATPLLVIRDPLALWLIYTSWKYNFWKINFFTVSVFFIVYIGIGFALIFGHGNISVALYGARIFILHFPLMFVIGKIFNKKDVEQLGRVTLILSIPMVILIGLQFYSPQSAWVNRGVGGDISGAGFSGAMGFYRPPGTFSFTIGNVLFYSLVSSFVFYYWLTNVKINRLILILSSVALLASLSFSISRTLVFTVLIVLLFSFVTIIRNPKVLRKFFLLLIVILMLFLILKNFSLIGTSMDAFYSRFDSASNIEGGVSNSLINRFFGAMFKSFSHSNSVPFFGYGIGIGTNVGAKILTGSSGFLVAEWEWARIIAELGFILGFFIILIRVLFSFSLVLKSIKELKSGNLLPWLLLSAGLVIILQGQWAQPTILGFSTVFGGLILASFNKGKNILISPH